MNSLKEKLRQLETSELFAPDLLSQPSWTNAEWAALDPERREHARRLIEVSWRRIADPKPLITLIRDVGEPGNQAAIPLLARLLSDCSHITARSLAGKALRKIGTPEARAAVEDHLDDADHYSGEAAIESIFDGDEIAAFERLAPYFDPANLDLPGGSVVPQRALQALTGRRGWWRIEPRWLDAAISLRRRRQLGGFARGLLERVEPGLAKAKLVEARLREPPREIQWRHAAVGDLLTRYRRGEHREVWATLAAFEAIDGDCRAEALAVADETMARVATCADVLAERLSARGWTALSGSLRHHPSSEDEDIVRQIQDATGAPLPPSVTAFWRQVGGIDFVWNYKLDPRPPSLGPDLKMDEMDPLCVDPARATRYLLEEWAEREAAIDPDLERPFSLDLAPDELHKANVSGGAPYGIELPFLGADPIFANEVHGLSFVNYLRLAMRLGGFPSLEGYASDPKVRAFVAEMTAGLEPF